MRSSFTILLVVILAGTAAWAQEEVSVSATASSSSGSTASSYTFSRVQDKSDESLYRKARNLYIKRQYTEATAVYESLLKHFPDSRRASSSIYYMGVCFEKLGYTEKAFDCYKKAVENYQNSYAGKVSLKRATDMAKAMRRYKGDEYDAFLEGIIRSENFTEGRRRYTAAVMASGGDWRGLDLLLESFEKGSTIEQIKVSELLTLKADHPKVQKAFKNALKNSSNVIVRANALYALQGKLKEKKGWLIYSRTLKQDPHYAIRARAFGMLIPYYKNIKGVRESFYVALAIEKDPTNLHNYAMFLQSRKEGDKLAEIATRRLKTERNPVNKMMLSSMLEHRSTLDLDMVQKLLDSPNAGVRISAIRVLQNKANNPEIRYMLVNKLKNDPSDQVRIGALNALSTEVVNDDVRRVVIETIEKSNDTVLVTTSIQVIRGQVHIKGVRDKLVKTLGTRSQSIVSYQLVQTLSPELRNEDVSRGFIRFLKDPRPDVEVKLAITVAMEKEDKLFPEARTSIQNLYITEKDVQLSDGYFRIISKSDPEKAKELKILKGKEIQRKPQKRKK